MKGIIDEGRKRGKKRRSIREGRKVEGKNKNESFIKKTFEKIKCERVQKRLVLVINDLVHPETHTHKLKTLLIAPLKNPSADWKRFPNTRKGVNRRQFIQQK